MKLDDYLTTREVMEKFRLSYKTIGRYVNDKIFHPRIVSRRRFFKKREIERYIANCREDAVV